MAASGGHWNKGQFVEAKKTGHRPIDTRNKYKPGTPVAVRVGTGTERGKLVSINKSRIRGVPSTVTVRSGSGKETTYQSMNVFELVALPED